MNIIPGCGQRLVLQDIVIVFGPGHPVVEQNLLLDLAPPPHSTEHSVQVPQAAQLPEAKQQAGYIYV